MNRIALRLLTLASLLFIGLAAQAQSSGVSWTYLEGGYQSYDGPMSLEGDGARFEGSLGINEWLYGNAAFESTDLDGIDDDLDIWSVGLGVHTPLNTGTGRGYQGVADRYSFFAEAAFRSSDSGSSDADGWSADVGFRTINFSIAEFIGKAGYEKFERVDGEFTLEGRLLVRIVNNLQAQTFVEWNDRDTRWFLGLRYSFGDYQLLD